MKYQLNVFCGTMMLCLGTQALAWNVMPMEPALALPEQHKVYPSSVEATAPVISLETKSSAPVLDLKPVELKSASQFKKNIALLNEDEQASVEYLEALEHLQSGREKKAIPLLEQSIAKAPRLLQARLELAKVYLRNHRDLDAQCTLEDGLDLSENHPEFLKLLAMIYEKRDQVEEALNCLRKIPVDKQNEKNTVALMGHLYHRLGHHSKAKEQYKWLMQNEPRNPMWILGLAVALESEGNKNAALEQYKKIQSEFGVDIKVSSFVEDRILAIKR